jgi:hypothetical protein
MKLLNGASVLGRVRQGVRLRDLAPVVGAGRSPALIALEAQRGGLTG